MMMVQHHEAAYWTRKCLDAFERYYEEGARRAKIMAIAIHPYISGQPFRVKYLEDVYRKINRKRRVLHWNGEQILDWYLKSKSGAGAKPAAPRQPATRSRSGDAARGVARARSR